MLKVKDSVGAIYKKTKDDVERWELVEDTISKIVENSKGRKYHTKKKFVPLDADDVDSNTTMQEKASGYIITKTVFGLNEVTRKKAEDWIVWANENMDKAVGLISGK